MEQRVKDILQELQEKKDEGYLFFTFVNEPQGICIHVKDEATRVDVFMKNLTLHEAKIIIVNDDQNLPGVTAVRPDSDLGKLFKRKMRE